MDVDSIAEIDYKGFLPAIKPKENEGVYNERGSKAIADLVLLDKKNFRVPGGRARLRSVISSQRKMK